MLEGEPHLKVVDEKRDSGKTRKLQVCSASVCVCVPVFLHAVARVGIVTGCVHMYNMSTFCVPLWRLPCATNTAQSGYKNSLIGCASMG